MTKDTCNVTYYVWPVGGADTKLMWSDYGNIGIYVLGMTQIIY